MPMFPVSVVPRAKMRATFLQGPLAWDSLCGAGMGAGAAKAPRRKRERRWRDLIVILSCLD